MPHCFHSKENNKTPRESKYDISRQRDKDEVDLGVIFNELCEKMTASNHTKKRNTLNRATGSFMEKLFVLSNMGYAAG